MESVKNVHSNKFNFIYQLWPFRDVDLYNVYIYKQYNVNQLEFVCEKFLRGLRESHHRRYFLPSSSNKMCLVFYFLENPHLNCKPVLSLVNHKIKFVRIKVGLQYTNGKELSDRKEMDNKSYTYACKLSLLLCYACEIVKIMFLWLKVGIFCIYTHLLLKLLYRII